MPVSGQYTYDTAFRLAGVGKHALRCLMLLALSALLTGCGGGGGGGTSGDGTGVSGIVLRAENNAVVVGATINVGGKQGTTGNDGSFSLSNVNSAATTATLTPPSPGKPRTLTLSLTPKVINNLGNIYTSDTGYTASATGTVVAPISGTQQPVGNATVTIAGTQVKTQTTGAFQIDNLPIGLGADLNTAIGVITAPNFDPKPIFTQYVFATGINSLGTLVLGAPVGTTPPTAPYTITGTVTVKGAATAGVAVLISNASGQQLGAANTDINGNYSFWVVAGTYTIEASYGTSTGSVTAVLKSPDMPITASTIAL